jgi:hypothetical protein
MTYFVFSGTLRSRAGAVYEGEGTQSIQKYAGSSGTGLYAVRVSLHFMLCAIGNATERFCAMELLMFITF